MRYPPSALDLHAPRTRAKRRISGSLASSRGTGSHSRRQRRMAAAGMAPPGRRAGCETAPAAPRAPRASANRKKIQENFRETQRGLAAGGGCPRVCPVTNPDEGDMRPAGGGAAGLRHANRTARSKAVCPPGERHRPAVRGSRLQLDGRGRSGPDATVEAPEDPWESSAPSALATAAGQGDPEVRRAPLTVDGARG